MTVRARGYGGEADYQGIRELLTETYGLTRSYRNWDIVRLDAFRFGRYGYQELSGERTWRADFRLWETASGKLVGVVHPEARNHIWLEVHPHYRHLEEEMLEWAEERHMEVAPQEVRRWPLNLFVYQSDEERVALVARRGYRNLGPEDVGLRCFLEEPIREAALPQGYGIRALRREDEGDVAGLASAVNLVFHTDVTPEAMWVCMGAPTPHEDLVVVAPGGTFAAFCTIWVDERNRVGAFEPVGTHPEYRRRGLGRAMVLEGLRRLRGWGARIAEVGTGYEAPALRFYRAVGFAVVSVVDRWRREF